MGTRAIRAIGVPTLLALGAGVVFATGSAADSSGQAKVLFDDVRVFDGKRVLAEADVLVEGDRIRKVEAGGEITPPGGATVVDGEGRTLLPGLLDAHGHMLTVRDMKDALLYGVTTVVSVGENPGVRDYVTCAGPETDRADMIISGAFATVAGSHGTEYPPEVFGDVPVLSNVSEVPGWVQARVDEGAHHIKVIVEDLSMFQETPTPKLPIDILEAVVVEAHAAGLKVVAHATKAADAKAALAAGVDGFAHAPVDPIDQEFVDMMLDRDAFMTPTLDVWRAADGLALGVDELSDPRIAPWLSPAGQALMSAAFPPEFGARWDYGSVKSNLAQLRAAGVPILAGTDAGNPGVPNGAGMHREMEMLVDAGMSPPQALRSATYQVAETYGLRDRGGIQQGKLADLLLVNGDPTVTILDSRDIAGIWRLGTRVDRADLLDQAGAGTDPTCAP
ncbi:amidohydrolase family protein [Streptosporangium fragile]|uniref:Amidohydrolase family protein n=1 Tax=Streptosporangium fragile TaxID=46186 RepID=A0ABP6IM02_9ACTN